jgi:hypothetical protein
MADPITGGRKRWEVEPAKENPTGREKARLQKRKERQKRREAEKKATKPRDASPNHATVLGPSKSRKA